MKYKQIILKKDSVNGFSFFESELPHDREDVGEYILGGIVANIYLMSDSVVWKRKLLEGQKEYVRLQIEKMTRFIEYIDRFIDETLTGV